MSGCLEGTHHQWPGFVDGTKISEQIYCFIPTFNLRLQASLLLASLAQLSWDQWLCTTDLFENLPLS